MQSLSFSTPSVSRRRALRWMLAGTAALIPVGMTTRAYAQATPTPTTPAAGLTPSPSASPSPTATPVPNTDPWVQTLRVTPLWSGPDDSAEQFGLTARWDYLKVARPQEVSRLYVYVARSGNYAWVDALAVGPSGPPPADWPPPDAPPPPADLFVGWVATLGDVPLYGDDAGTLMVGLAPAWSPLKQLVPQQGAVLAVEDPLSGGQAYVLAEHVGPIDPPAGLAMPPRWWGVLGVDGANLRATPTTREPALGQLALGTPMIVSDWVEGEEALPDNPTWARLGDGSYAHSSVLRPVALPAAPPPPDDAARLGSRWIDLNLTHQVTVAYQDQAPIYLARTSTGRPGWLTDPGVFSIQRRVENETMQSSSLLGLDAQRADYKVENVRWTQYFTADGKALHENYWKPRDQFGIPSSHGCAGLVAEDARFFWDWASIGTPVYAHY